MSTERRAILGDDATVDEKAAFVIAQAEDPAVLRALHRRLVRNIGRAETALAQARADLDALTLALEIQLGETLRPRRSPVRGDTQP